LGRRGLPPEACVKRHALDGQSRVALGEVAALAKDLCQNAVDEGEGHKPLANLGERSHVGNNTKNVFAVAAIQTTHYLQQLGVGHEVGHAHAIQLEEVPLASVDELLHEAAGAVKCKPKKNVYFRCGTRTATTPARA
jgi:hypothetical protein